MFFRNMILYGGRSHIVGYRRAVGRWDGDQPVRTAAGAANAAFWIRPLQGQGPSIINTGCRICLPSLSN
jgi:hypothetical protein